MMGGEVKDNRRGMERLLGDLEFIDDNVIDSGILVHPQGQSTFDADVIMIDDDKNQNQEGLTVGNVAGFHEFGMGVPERSFVRATFDNETHLIERRIIDGVDDVFAGKGSASESMAEIGKFAAGEMVATIEESKGIVPLSRQRLEEKKRIGTPSTPLINWSILIQTLDYRVHGKL